ncbi:hypothetical protein Lfu02_23810 [Longispora fulva]|uniref:S-adenosylmethionine:diacylglycerol 3-amino-3-carboxypropyl transferase n=1 Tax=Longispora fulva TaxID=619741 RepID=A0A8J7KLP6_9ACTN|nr:hypothetical protein [Longispora fulva]MBG6139609.1 S-adenosylmethionine:diacylglycerol 3-amino-3-carboxypropyl transferase [Longispora fulva]GIG58009.1 hypothetical protein Lfu02_23810 [Longispora fulva]
MRLRIRLIEGAPHDRGEVIAEYVLELEAAKARFVELLDDPRRAGRRTFIEADVPGWTSNPTAEAIRQHIRHTHRPSITYT